MINTLNQEEACSPSAGSEPEVSSDVWPGNAAPGNTDERGINRLLLREKTMSSINQIFREMIQKYLILVDFLPNYQFILPFDHLYCLQAFLQYFMFLSDGKHAITIHLNCVSAS